MKIKLSKWGNSLAVRIPASLASEASLKDGSPLNIEYVNGALHLVPQSQEPNLDELLSGITEDNLHSEVQTGDMVGNESW